MVPHQLAGGLRIGAAALSRSSAVPREPTEISAALDNYRPISSLLPFWKAGELSRF